MHAWARGVLLAALLFGAGPQERAPNGYVYRELLPFVGLDAVRLELTGLGVPILDVSGEVPGDRVKTLTGLSQAEHEQLRREILSDITGVLSNANVPLLPASATRDDIRPALSMEITWGRPTADFYTVQVRVRLLEAARLVKDPSRIERAATWEETYNSVAAPENLASVIRSVARGEAQSFARLYARAHAK